MSRHRDKATLDVHVVRVHLDPDEGDPDGGIPPGTDFDDIPDSWFCPVCGARKTDFEPYEM